jgi:hypothetical protein
MNCKFYSYEEAAAYLGYSAKYVKKLCDLRLIGFIVKRKLRAYGRYQRLTRVIPEWDLYQFAIQHAGWRYVPASANEAFFAAQAKAIREATPADLLEL